MTNELEANVNVTVEVNYLKQESSPTANSYVYAYTVTINNTSNKWCQLLYRHWVITDSEGGTEEVQGEGVIGEQPKLDLGEMFRYSSYAVIATPIGSMHGHYEFQDREGKRFLVPIPAFSLTQTALVH